MTNYLHRMSGPGAAGDVWISTMHTSGAANLATAHGAWQTFVTAIFNNALKTRWAVASQITSLQTVSLDPVTGKQTAVTATSVALIGTSAGQMISPRSCMVLSLRTALPTKAGRGRMYLPPPDSTHLTGSGLLLGSDAAAIATAIGTAMTTFKATSQPVVYHQKTKTVDNITYVAVGQVLGSQTRRTNRVFNAYSTATI
jgi:ethanolamine utilization microcompartment shell protein EutL